MVSMEGLPSVFDVMEVDAVENKSDRGILRPNAMLLPLEFVDDIPRPLPPSTDTFLPPTPGLVAALDLDLRGFLIPFPFRKSCIHW